LVLIALNERNARATEPDVSREEEKTVMPAEELKLSQPVKAKPLDQWQSIAVELLGTETRIVKGEHSSHRVIEVGEGDPLFLIHGVGGHAETYARNLHNLAKHFHVYAIDALYHGFSSKGDFDRSQMTVRQAGGLADLIKTLGYSWAHVEGESMGAEIVWEFGMHYPEMAGKLIMNTGAPYYHPKKTDFVENPGGGSTLAELSRKSVLEPSFETVKARMQWLVADPSRMTDEMVNVRLRLYSFPEVYNSIKRVYGMSGENWNEVAYIEEEDVATFKPDPLVFWTEKNPGQGPDYGRYFADLIPGAKFYSMQDAAHWPQWEKPEEHDQVLIDFIKS
jgi:2-hydroxy-6-oxonona-2,4-dienedioate hydrolase/2-hydroxy-6-oxo-6-(2'-carboxyphenyl)-hexa-2,4-dienoate hydrolase